MALLFVHEAACNGLVLQNSSDGTPDLVAEDICVAAAKCLGCELGDTDWETMLTRGREDARALPIEPSGLGTGDAS